MLGRQLRVFLALAAIAPLSVSLAYIYAAKDQSYQFAVIAVCFCILLGASSQWVIGKAQEKLEHLLVICITNDRLRFPAN